ncbi:hypothetical protein HLB25_15665 [Dickeya dadantii]|uniref:hypothetical protein n=1 Tax=Dickeya dadantii TaxID=204038 RepID=UPI0014957076|nr:hypothetical protein [Dickeya dadantii]NPE55969.1 hypothetical protein [Dickeya dadantii]NPE68063.1 hypothetical protein [Dickeya dadantii]
MMVEFVVALFGRGKKKELVLPEKAFAREIRDTCFQSKPWLAAKLVSDGLLEHRMESQQSRFGLMSWEHVCVNAYGPYGL